MMFMMPYCQALEKLGLLGKLISREEKEFMIERGRYMYACGEAPISAAVRMLRVIVTQRRKLSPGSIKPMVENGITQVQAWVTQKQLSPPDGERTITLLLG